MKKGVVLLITLFFITAISVMVLKNLDDTDIFLEKQNYKLHNTQVLVAIQNTQEELVKLIKKYENEIDEALKNDILNGSLPINVNDLDIAFRVNKYAKVDINDLQKKDSRTVESFFLSNDIFNYDKFLEVYKEKIITSNKKVETSNQLDDIINTYVKRTNNQDIEKIIENLGFISGESLYELYIDVNYLSSTAKSYYLLNNEGKVLYFDIEL